MRTRPEYRSHTGPPGQLGVAWDNGRSLSLIPGVDSYRKLTQQEIAQKQGMKMEEMTL